MLFFDISWSAQKEGAEEQIVSFWSLCLIFNDLNYNPLLLDQEVTGSNLVVPNLPKLKGFLRKDPADGLDPLEKSLKSTTVLNLDFENAHRICEK